MSICPRTMEPCIDDMCYGGGCMEMEGYEMLEVCQFCGGTIDHEIAECSTCTCDEEDREGVA